jgi:hypothetical protein
MKMSASKQAQSKQIKYMYLKGSNLVLQLSAVYDCVDGFRTGMFAGFGTQNCVLIHGA